jgi:hypothetical protein
MIAKIVSGGQTGVDRAALDAAVKLGIPHGGWVPKGRLAEDGTIAQSYRLRETNSAAYVERTEKNVVDSDGTLIISRGGLSGGSETTRQKAIQHGRPWLHIDLSRTSAFNAAMAIKDWLASERIAVLNVAGPRASKDPTIYRDALGLLEAVYHLSLTEPAPGELQGPASRPPDEAGQWPSRVKDAVAALIAAMPLKDRVTIANMTEGELASLAPTVGSYIVSRFNLPANAALIRSCRWVARTPVAREDEAARVIIRELWKQLRRTHPLRRVK